MCSAIWSNPSDTNGLGGRCDPLGLSTPTGGSAPAADLWIRESGRQLREPGANVYEYVSDRCAGRGHGASLQLDVWGAVYLQPAGDEHSDGWNVYHDPGQQQP